MAVLSQLSITCDVRSQSASGRVTPLRVDTRINSTEAVIEETGKLTFSSVSISVPLNNRHSRLQMNYQSSSFTQDHWLECLDQ